MNDRHGRARGPAYDLDLGLQLLGERLDEAGAEAGSFLPGRLGADLGPANSVVRDRKLPRVHRRTISGCRRETRGPSQSDSP